MADFLSKIFLLSPQKSENNHLGEASLMLIKCKVQ